MRHLGLAVVMIAQAACVADRNFPLPTESWPDTSGEITAGSETADDAERLARIWIDYWNLGNPRALPLAKTFVHTSPFGRLEGRDHYLETVIPMSQHNVTKLTINRVLGRGNQAVIWFDMQTPAGAIPACDWVTVANGEISEIRSFYDASMLRAEYAH